MEKKSFKKVKLAVAAMLLSICMAVVLPITSFAEDKQLIYGTDGTITRAEWVHDLVTAFDMTMSEGLKPDNYYADIAENQYYNDILTAMYFGVIDLEAGEKFEPDGKVTREFAAHTLSYCMGYELEKDTTYTMSDIGELLYPNDDQIAVNKGWFSLVSGKFMPGQYVSSTEVKAMLDDAAKVLEESKVDENHENQYTFESGVKEVPESSRFEFSGDNEITLYDTAAGIQTNDVFAVYSNGIAYTYKAVNVETKEDSLVITTEDVMYEDAVKYVDAEGVIEADLNDFVPEEGVNTEVEYAEEEMGAQSVSGTKKIGKVNISKSFGAGSVNCSISNIKVDYKINNSGYRFAVTGKINTKCSFSGKKDLTLTLGYINVAGVGKVQLQMIYSAKGSATVGFTTNAITGVEKKKGQAVRHLDNYTSPTWNFSAKAELKTACNLNFSVDIPMVANGRVYGETGIKSTPEVEVYTDGNTPKTCMDLPVYLYAEAGCSLNVFGESLVNETVPIYTASNSPIRICYHIEDGKCVKACSRPGSSSRVGKRGYYTSPDLTSASGTYGGECFAAPYEEVKIFEYKVDSEGNATITKYSGNVSALTIPDDIDGYPVVAIGANAFSGNGYLQSVVVPDGVTSIGEGAFSECPKLQSAVLPNNSNYKTISKKCFYNDAALSVADMSEYITKISSNAFENCGFVSLDLSDNITEIASNAYYGCKNISKLKLPKYLEKFGNGTFGDCDALQEVEIPKYIKDADDIYPNVPGGLGYSNGMFGECDNLKTITFAKGIGYIPLDLFNNCSGLEEITIPDTVTEIQNKAFYNCHNLKKVNLPKSLTKIGVLAFASCDSLESIEIPDAVTSIDCCAFEWCGKLANVKFPLRLKEIGTWAFKECTSLTEIELPKNLTDGVMVYYNGMTIYKTESPFVGCKNLKKVVFQEGATVIPKYIFRCFSEGLEEVIIPDTVIEIRDGAFDSCRELQKLKLPKNLVSIGENAFIACSSLESIEIPDTVNNIGSSAFEACSKLTSIKLPKYRVGIPSSCFKDCTSLVKIEFPEGLQYIRSSAFENCEKLESITVPQNFKSIGATAFKNCKRLSSVDLHGDYIDEYAFEGCVELTSVKMSNELYGIGKGAFLNCSSLETLQLSTGLKGIYENTFKGCTYLDNLIIPYRVSFINDNAFKDCTRLRDITILEHVSSIAANAFSYPDDTTIHGVKGSYAQTYAKENDINFKEETISATSVKIPKDTFEINLSDDTLIPIAIDPLNCTESVSWESSDESIATISATGVVKGKTTGECTVKVTVGAVSDTCKIVIKKKPYLYINGENMLVKGEQTQLLCTSGEDENVSNDKILWWSSNPNIATVDQEGKVTAVANGKVTISVWLKEDIERKNSFEMEIVDEKPAPTPTVTPTVEPQPTVAPTTEPQPTVAPTTEPQPTVTPTTEPQPTAVPTTEPQPTAVPTTKPQPTIVPTAKPQPTAVPTTKPQPTVVPTTKPQPTVVPTTKPQPTAVPTQKPQSTVKPQQPQAPNTSTGTSAGGNNSNNANTGANNSSSGSSNISGGSYGNTGNATTVSKITMWKITQKGKGKVKVICKKVSGSSGYQVQYSLNKKMRAAKLKKCKAASLTIKKLKKKKTYYVRVRAYKMVNGRKVYGKWSGVKKVKIKK